MKFKCRVCGSNSYQMHDNVFKCQNCSVVFDDIEKFSIDRVLKIKYLDNYMSFWPSMDYEYDSDSGLDLRACIDYPITLMPYSEAKWTMNEKLFCKIPFGVSIQLTENDLDAKIYNRSGLSSKYGVGIRNRVGVIDNTYRGELMGFFVNEGTEPYTINPGDRVAQLVIEKRVDIDVVKVDHLEDTVRGSGGFNSTGKN